MWKWWKNMKTHALFEKSPCLFCGKREKEA
jgi:hypothetical protein